MVHSIVRQLLNLSRDRKLNQQKRRNKNMTNISKSKAFFTLFICLAGILFTLPSLVDDKEQNIFPSWMRKVNLGLDLQGGSQILLKIDMETGIKDSLIVSLD